MSVLKELAIDCAHNAINGPRSTGSRRVRLLRYTARAPAPPPICLAGPNLTRSATIFGLCRMGYLALVGSIVPLGSTTVSTLYGGSRCPALKPCLALHDLSGGRDAVLRVLALIAVDPGVVAVWAGATGCLPTRNGRIIPRGAVNTGQRFFGSVSSGLAS